MLASAFASASVLHPANIPSARVHVGEYGRVSLHIRFDILAYCLDATPQDISDAAMNALLEGPAPELQNRLDEAKNRFIADLKVSADSGLATMDSIRFPTAAEVLKSAAENGAKRLPVMMTVLVDGALPTSARTISCRLPDVLGSVVVTTEMPYEEPVSEPVDPGAASTPLPIPSADQIASAKRAISARAAVSAVTPMVAKDPTPKQAAKPVAPIVEDKSVSRPPKPQPSLARATLGPPRPKPGPAIIAPTSQAVKTATIAPDIPQEPEGRPAWYLMIGRYVKMGFQHILPNGLDHILFVLGLFLLSRKTKSLLSQISAFTVAHSLTLALSLYGVISLPSSIVEPLIALSIVFVAVENLFTTETKAWRPFIVFGFGLVHGLGFASALKETGLAHGDFLTGLVGFNTGVELGQLSVVALALVAVGWLRSKPSYRMAVVIPASCAIALVALVWTIERTLS